MEWIIFYCCIFTANALQPAISKLGATGYQFQPVNYIELLATFHNVHTIIHCAMLSYQNSLCRTYDYDSNTKQCRLFEGSVDTGTLLSTSLSSSIVGWFDLDSPLFSLYNAPASQCTDNRYLYSNGASNRCECPCHTFWNGSMCINQRFYGEVCVNSDWCRNDLSIYCVSSICISNSTTSTSTSTSTTTTTTSTVTTITTSTTTTTSTTSTTSTSTIIPNVTLYSVTNPTSPTFPTYTYYSYTWIATSSLATLSFFFRHDPGAWLLDDVNVYHGSAQLITNGGFESGDLTGWSYSGTCNVYKGTVLLGSLYAHSGSYYYNDPCSLHGDTISQTFSTIIGDTYNISFWLTNYLCCGATEIASITLT